jgi:diacylglycerol kinase family enzyme
MPEFDSFAACICDLLVCSPLLNKENLIITLIINPAAGGFRRKSLFLRLLENLSDVRDRAVRDRAAHERLAFEQSEAGEKPRQLFDYYVFITGSPGDALKKTEELVKSNEAVLGEKEFLVITAGGDGTAAEAAQAVAEASEHIRERFTLFRLPLGTGNDGLDAPTLDQAWSLLLGPSRRKRIGYIKAEPNGSDPLYAFNIASIGVDGYITELTNTIKRVIPGSFYSLMVDVAALFYERRVDSLDLEIEIGKMERKQGEYLLVAFGVSGNRNYGGGKRILPGEENVCLLRPMTLPRKFRVKKLIYLGAHDGLPEVELLSADSLTINGPCRLPIQCDGESKWLSKEEFPLVLNRVEPAIYVLSKL